MSTSNTRQVMLTKVAWDLGDTLVKIKDLKLQEAAARVSIQLCRQITAHQLASVIRQEWANRKDPRSLDRIRNIDSCEAEVDYWENDFYPNALSRLGMLHSSQAICAWFAELQMSPQSYELMPHAKRTLDLLRSAGIEQALISNAFPSARKIIKRHNLEKYFKLIVLSCDYKLVKPDVKIYELLEKEFNLTDEDKMIFIDDRKEFLEIPTHLNIIPVWLNNGFYKANDWHGERICGLREVTEYYFRLEDYPAQQDFCKAIYSNNAH